MRPFTMSDELRFRQESMKRTILNLHEIKDHEGMLKVALMMNGLWHQQAAISNWLAHEAADNLGEAWGANGFR